MTKESTVFWTCKYCGKDTSHVEADYLSGYNHLSCVLEYEVQSKEVKPKYLNIPFDLIHNTPNDFELGEKVRRLYYEQKDNS